MTAKGKPLRAVPPAKPNRGGRPRKLANARDERELLVILRRKLAARIDGDDVPPHALHHLVKQLRDFDKEIRAIDARAAERAAEETFEDEDDDAGWNPSAI